VEKIFTPHHGFLFHQKISFTAATYAKAYLLSLQEETFTEPRCAHPAGDGCVTIQPSTSPKKFKHTPHNQGPIYPTGTCLKTGRRLRLITFRDLSCAILRQSDDETTWEALPSVVGMRSDVIDASASSIPHHKRSTLPFIRTAGKPEGLHWTAHNFEISPEDLLDILKTEIEQKALEICEKHPVADPRQNLVVPQGARFDIAAHFSTVTPENPLIKTVKSYMEASIFNDANCLGDQLRHQFFSISIRPRLQNDEDSPRAKIDINWNEGIVKRSNVKAARAKCYNTLSQIPDNVSLGAPLFLPLDPPTTAHGIMQNIQLLQEIIQT
jgi:hypothetical protein